MSTITTSHIDAFERLDQLEVSVRRATTGAQRYLKGTFKTLKSEDEITTKGGWSQFLNEVDKPPSAAGTSHGILSLLACGEPRDSKIIVAAANFLANDQCYDGSWTKPTLHNKCGLTRITGLSLRALLYSRVHESSMIQKGTKWLLEAQNSDGGWGNSTRDGKSDVTSTSFALQALTKIVGLLQDDRQRSIQWGKAWLIDAQKEDYSWGDENHSEGTVAHTSEAVDGLLACGQDLDSLLTSAQWISRHIKIASPFSEGYRFPKGNPCEGTRVIWTQASKERGLITLLELGSNLFEKAVIHAVDDILSRQVNGTYWKDNPHHVEEPIWALKEAVIALRLSQDWLNRNRSILILSKEISTLSQRLTLAQRQIDGLLNREMSRSWNIRLRNLWLAVRRPKLSVTITVVLCIIIITLAPEKIATTLLVAVSILGAAWSYLGLRKRGGK